MKNKGPVYNMTTGKLDFPIDDHAAIDMEGHISYRVGEYTSYSPMPVNNNDQYQYKQWDPEIHPKKPAGSSKVNLTFWQVVGVLAVIGVTAALYYYGFR
jgi:hypothetical protein